MGLTLIRDTDNVIEFDAAGLLTDLVTGAVIPAAVVEITLRNHLDTADIGGETWPLSLPAVAPSGNYRATLTDSLVLAGEQEVIGVLTADNGPDARTTWRLRMPVADLFS